MPFYPFPPLSKVVSKPGNPGAGNNFTITIPNNQIYLPIACKFIFTTDETVAARFPAISFTDGTDNLIASHTPIAQPASKEITYNFFISSGNFFDAFPPAFVFVPMPQLFYMPPGWELISLIHDIQSGDVISDVIVTFLSWTSPQST